MSESKSWHDWVVTLDDHGLEMLSSAVGQVIESLRSEINGPRSSLTPTELHRLVASIEVCPDQGAGLAKVLEEMGSVVWANGVVASDPATVAHLHPPTLVPSVVTELAISATNQSMDSWDQAPIATEVELHLMRWLTKLIGMPDSGSGVMTSGGTASNVLGITLARSFAAAAIGIDVLKSGLPPESVTWRILCSDQAHFSVQRAAAQLGLGRDAVLSVPTTDAGAMSVSALDDVLDQLDRENNRAICIVATAGTTDLGAVDPLEEIARRARSRAAWFHVDAAVGGAFLLSSKLRPVLSGLDLADSVTIDFHKLWWQPFNASALVVRDVLSFDLLRVKSSYLDRGDELEGMVNLVGRSLDTSRRFDAAKVLVTLRSLGRRTLSEMLEQLVRTTTYAATRIQSQTGFHLLAAPSTVMCVFDIEGASAQDLRDIQQRLLARGEMVLGRTQVKGRDALKFTFMNPLTTDSEVDRLIEQIVQELDSIRGESRA